MNDFSLLDWNSISSDYMDASTKFDIFYDQISQFINLMYHVESSLNVKLSYLLSPGLLNLFLPKFDIEISSIPKSLGANIQIQIWYIFIRNSGIVLSKTLKRENLTILRITFCVRRIIWKKIWSGIDQSSKL